MKTSERLELRRRPFLGASVLETSAALLGSRAAPGSFTDRLDAAPQRARPVSNESAGIELLQLSEKNVQLRGQKNGFKGDFRGREWVGVPFSPDGAGLVANLQSPGITFAITGPWEALGL